MGLAFALLGAAASLLLSLGLYLAVDDLERRLIDDILAAELQDYASRRARNPVSPPPRTKTIRGYVAGSGSPAPGLPAPLAALEEGWHEVDLEGHRFRARVEDRGGERLYILYDLALLERRRAYFLIILAVGVVVMTGLSALIASRVAGSAIAPVTALARRVRALGPDDRLPALAGEFAADEVGELARAFDQYRARLAAFIERERAFTADVSHELRTPLAVIQGAVELALTAEDLSPVTRERLLRMQRAAAQMSELTAALLALAREQRIPAAPAAHCPADQVLREVVEDHRHLLAGKAVELAVELPAPVRLPVECGLLRIVFANLVGNAFSYTRTGRVRLRLEAERLQVEDTGTGIETEHLQQVFERYYRGRRSGEGAGIGLSLVKRICDAHGWRIALESAPGRGTRIELYFSGPRS